MCKTAVLRNIGGFVDFPKAWGSDDATWFLMANKNGIVASSKILCKWRQSKINLSRKGTVETKLNAVNIFKNWLQDFIENRINVTEKEKDLLSELKKNFNQRICVQQGIALKLGVGFKRNQYLRILFQWIRYRKKYSLQLFPLIWALIYLTHRVCCSGRFRPQ